MSANFDSPLIQKFREEATKHFFHVNFTGAYVGRVMGAYEQELRIAREALRSLWSEYVDQKAQFGDSNLWGDDSEVVKKVVAVLT